MGFEKTIQVRGVEGVTKTFTNRGTEAWAIFQDKDLIAKGIGEDDLRAFLQLIEAGSPVTYILKIYDDITDAKQIKEKTDADGSIRFKLVGEDQDYNGYGDSNRKNRLFQRLETIENYITRKIKEEEEDELSEEEEPESIGNVMIGLLKRPGELKELIEAGKTLMGMLPSLFAGPSTVPMNMQPALVPATRIGATTPEPSEQETTNEELTEAKILRFQTAINDLEQNDPQLLEHLETLADLSNKEPGQFKYLLSLLDHMKAKKP